MQWVDELRAAGRLASGTQRHLVSRFFAWCLARGHASVNPVRQIPSGQRPQHAPKRDVPWLEDDSMVTTLMNRLPEAVGLMFYIGNRSGLRLGEICGLRLSDMEGLADGAIRVRYSYTGPLKEDRHGVGKVKFAPAPDDAGAVLGPWIEKRRAEGAGPEAFVFARADGTHLRKEFVEWHWERARDALGLKLTFYEGSRHSFASRNFSRGIGLEEISSALGHSTPAITLKSYQHWVRKTFSPGIRASLQTPPGAGGKVIPLGVRGEPVSPVSAIATDDAEDLRPTWTETRKVGAR
jgi:integrase